jgi:uroporphyrinogen-III synthase
MLRPRILITRSPHQASALADELVTLGAEPVLVPTIELTEPTSYAALDDALSRLDVFDWVLFTSANAVEAFVKRALKPMGSVRKVGAIGPATARAVEVAGLRVDLMPEQSVAESLVEALQPFLYQEDGRATRFLLVRAEVARELLPDSLREGGAEVTVVPAYRTVIPAGSVAAMRELFGSRERWPAAITFTSSSSATNLLSLLEDAGVGLPEEVLRVSIGPITSRTLRELGYPPHAEAHAPTIYELAAAAIRALV